MPNKKEEKGCPSAPAACFPDPGILATTAAILAVTSCPTFYSYQISELQ
jgi:hypothetical protein